MLIGLRIYEMRAKFFCFEHCEIGEYRKNLIQHICLQLAKTGHRNVPEYKTILDAWRKAGETNYTHKSSQQATDLNLV
jgi:hypothetical protein